MMFSVEPGLFDVNNGIGINPSDNLLITKKGGGPDEPRALFEKSGASSSSEGRSTVPGRRGDP